MSTTTSRLNLYKPASDGSEYVNVVTDLNNNYDAIDLAVGSRPVTSTTRPSTPYGGQHILETDTGYRTLVHNGTSPASGGWIEIPNSAATYSGQILASRSVDSNTLRLANTFAGGNSTPTITTEHATSTGASYGTRQAGDGFDRFRIRADGRIDIGSGSAARDTNLYRNGVGLLRTDGAFSIGGAATLNSTLAVTGNTTIGGNLTIAGIGQRQTAYRTADSTPKSSDTTLANDTQLTLAVAANATYTLRGLLGLIGPTTADIKIKWSGPTGASLDWSGIGQDSTLAGGTGTVNTVRQVIGDTVAYGTITGSVPVAVVLDGFLVTSGTAGSLTLQWAQNTSTAGNSIIKAASYFTLERVA